MRTLLTLLAALAAWFLAGCATPTPPAPLQSTFNADEVAFIHEQGTNTIEGNAFLRQRGGGVVTCAGEIVALIPKGTYSTELMVRLYGAATVPGYRPYYLGRNAPVGPKAFYFASRHTVCDSDGRFKFENVAAGSYFVRCAVKWEVQSIQGGYLMEPVTFAGSDEVRNVVLTAH